MVRRSRLGLFIGVVIAACGAMPAMAQTQNPTALLYNGDPATELGEYIFRANPYKAGQPPEGVWDRKKYPNGPPPTVTFPSNGQPTDKRYALDWNGAEMHEKPGLWKFKYGDHYIARGIRVPYMYYSPSPADPNTGMLVRDYFVIGFEGGAGY